MKRSGLCGLALWRTEESGSGMSTDLSAQRREGLGPEDRVHERPAAALAATRAVGWPRISGLTPARRPLYWYWARAGVIQW